MKRIKSLKAKRIVAVASFLVFLGVMAYLTYFLWSVFKAKIDTPTAFKALIDSYGWKGYLIAFAIQIIQVFVALIPGEMVEIGMGYAFGWLGGTVICLGGVAIASAIVFLLTKRAGKRLVELFVSEEKINSLRFLNSEEKLRLTVFLLFFIPGTPKDLLTYFVGLTRISLSEFLAISLVARIPSVVSSVLVGHFAVEEQYALSAVIFVITAFVSLGGLLVYNKFVKAKRLALKEKHRINKEKRKEAHRK